MKTHPSHSNEGIIITVSSFNTTVTFPLKCFCICCPNLLYFFLLSPLLLTHKGICALFRRSRLMPVLCIVEVGAHLSGFFWVPWKKLEEVQLRAQRTLEGREQSWGEGQVFARHSVRIRELREGRCQLSLREDFLLPLTVDFSFFSGKVIMQHKAEAWKCI